MKIINKNNTDMIAIIETMSKQGFDTDTDAILYELMRNGGSVFVDSDFDIERNNQNALFFNHIQ